MPRVSRRTSVLKQLVGRSNVGITALADYEKDIETIQSEVLETGLEAILKSLDAQLNAARSPDKAGSPDLSLLGSSIGNIVDRHRIDEAFQANKLAINSLLMMAVNRSVLGKFLSDRSAEIWAKASLENDPDETTEDAQNAAQDATSGSPFAPATLTDFVAKLFAARLPTRAVFDISKGDLKALVQLISARKRGLTLPALASLKPAVLNPILARYKRAATVGDPVVERTIDDWFQLPDNPELGMKWQIRHWQSDDEKRVTGLPNECPMPHFDTVEEYESASAIFAALEIDWTNATSIEIRIGAYLRYRYSSKAQRYQYPVNWVRAWIYILFARHDSARFREVFAKQADGYFDGLTLARKHNGTMSTLDGMLPYEVRVATSPG